MSTVSLLEVEPDIARFLTTAELDTVQRVAIPVSVVQKGPLDVTAVLQDANAFGAVVLDGMLLQRLRVGEQVALRLLGPGDTLSLSVGSRSILLSEFGCRAAARTILALLGNEVLAASHRWPRIVAGLHVRMAEQADRLATQLAICQLPRVDQRLLALMWLLAESWGQVTPAGTRLPLALTHDALGALVGARRPTVTLALGELTERGAIVRQDRGWLLLEPPPISSGEVRSFEEPSLLSGIESAWASDAATDTTVGAYTALLETVGRLREEHLRNIVQFNERITRLVGSRERCTEVRRRVSRQRLRPRRPPST
jgi:hypothetical protein